MKAHPMTLHAWRQHLPLHPHPHPHPHPHHHHHLHLKPHCKLRHACLAVLATAGLLAACGGGGGGSGTSGPTPTVSLSSTSSVKYSETMLVTLSGTLLDQTLTLTSAGCRDFVRSTTAPNASTATTAYYTCRVSGIGNQSIAVAASGTAIASVPFSVAAPQVSLAISNGAGLGGTVVMTLSPEVAPLTVDNFLAYVKSGFYNGVAFHRHGRYADLSTFVLQSGGYAAPLRSNALFPAHKPESAAIALEANRGLSNRKYTLAMARLTAPDSATSEFFINTADNVFLDTSGSGYAVFGSIVSGMALVDAMVAAPCNLSPLNFNSTNPLDAASKDCLPEPNLVITNALQTR